MSTGADENNAILHQGVKTSVKKSTVNPHPSLTQRMTEIIGVGGDLRKSHVLQDRKPTFPGVTWKEQ